eukprot:m.48830 g.48830  ORF g.48830 m.48830 type:complete len:283 (-) comp6064_c0_seq3:290-1138(-)
MATPNPGHRMYVQQPTYVMPTIGPTILGQQYRTPAGVNVPVTAHLGDGPATTLASMYAAQHLVYGPQVPQMPPMALQQLQHLQHIGGLNWQHAIAHNPALQPSQPHLEVPVSSALVRTIASMPMQPMPVRAATMVMPTQGTLPSPAVSTGGTSPAIDAPAPAPSAPISRTRLAAPVRPPSPEESDKDYTAGSPSGDERASSPDAQTAYQLKRQRNRDAVRKFRERHKAKCIEREREFQSLVKETEALRQELRTLQGRVRAQDDEISMLRRVSRHELYPSAQA